MTNPYEPPTTSESATAAERRFYEAGWWPIAILGVVIGAAVGMLISGYQDAIASLVFPAFGWIGTTILLVFMIRDSNLTNKGKVLCALLLPIPAYILYVPVCVVSSMCTVPFLGGIGSGPNAGLLRAWLGDGKTVLWGLTGGYIGVEVAKWSLHIKVSTGDTFVVPVALAIAIGRVGCFLFGCCYGIATNQDWGVRFLNAPDAGTMLRHPTQLYELLFHLSFAIAASAALSQSTNKLLLRLRGNWNADLLSCLFGLPILQRLLATRSTGLIRLDVLPMEFACNRVIILGTFDVA